MIIAVHNPTYTPQKYLRIQVPHGNYDVYGFDYAAEEFKHVPAKAICQKYILENN